MIAINEKKVQQQMQMIFKTHKKKLKSIFVISQLHDGICSEILVYEFEIHEV